MKRRSVFLVLLLTLVACILVMAVPTSRHFVIGKLRGEPFSRGKPVSYWIAALADPEQEEEAFEAIQELRGQAVPCLLRAICELQREEEKSDGWLRQILLELGLAKDQPVKEGKLYGLMRKVPHDEAAPYFCECVASSDEYVRAAAVEYLSESLKSLEVRRLLMQACQDPAKRVRLAAISSLAVTRLVAGRKVHDVLRPLEQATHDPDPEVRCKAISSFNYLCSSAGYLVARLIQLLDDPEIEVRQEAARALGTLGEDAVTAVPALLRLVRQQDEACHYARRALGRIAPMDPEVLSVLIQEFRRDPAIADILWEMGPRAKVLPELIRALEKGPYYNPAVFRAIGAMGPEAGAAIPTMKQLLLDADPGVRLRAAETLRQIEGRAEDVMPVVVDALPRVEKFWIISFHFLVKVGPAAKDVVPLLIQTLPNAESHVRIQCLELLAAIGPDAKDAYAVLVAQAMIHDHLRAEAIHALGCLRQEARAALPMLRGILASNKEMIDVRTQAALAIWRITGDATESLPVLRETLATSRSNREALVKALGEFGPAAKPLTPAIEPLLSSQSVMLRLEAIRTYYRITSDAAPLLPILKRMAATDDWMFGSMAIDLLGELGPAAQDAIPVLTECLKDESCASASRRPRRSSAFRVINDQASLLRVAPHARGLHPGDGGAHVAALRHRQAARRAVQPRQAGLLLDRGPGRL